jgi:predicted exporter
MEESELIDVIIDGCNRAKSVEIRKNLWMDGDEQKVEYVCICRLKTGGFSRKTADTAEAAIRKAVADVD